ncbi:MAG: hypothetical protein MJ096_05850, partial [Clostridia bacterium]|nr:hypothetical protein [Clostridia bacterium]
KQYFTICKADYFTFAVRQIFHLKYQLKRKNRLILLACDKDVFTDADFVRQNPMLVIDMDKFEFVGAEKIIRNTCF